MRISMTIVSTLLISATLGHNMGQAQSMEPTEFSFIDLVNQFYGDVKFIVDFYRDASHKTDLDVALSALLEDLAEKGYSLKSSSEGDSIRIGVRRYDLGTYSTARHFATSDGNIWLDMVTYPDAATIRAFWETFKGSQPYGGVYTNAEWIFITTNRENNAVEAVFRSDREVINIGVSLPITMPDDISKLSQLDLQTIRARIDTLCEVTRLVVAHLVSDEDLAMMPLPGGQLTALQRVVEFVHLWSEVKYNFAFFDKVPHVNWESILHRYLPRVEKEQTTEEYYRLLQECLALLHDGHTSIFSTPSGVVQLYSPPLRILPLQGKAIIVEVAGEASQKGLEPGMEITYIDGRSVGEILHQDIYPYISANTPQGRDMNAYGASLETSFATLLEGPPNTSVKLRIRDLEGKIRDMTLIRRLSREQLPWYWRNRPLVEYRQLSEDIAYIALNTFRVEGVVTQFDELFERIRQAKGLILDIRENSGGRSSYGYKIIGRLIDKPLKNERWKTRQYMPAFRSWGREEGWYEGEHDPPPVPRGNHPFLGPLVVLIGPGTASAAETFLVPLHASGRAILVGEKTAGSTGNPLVIPLPGGGTAGICTLRSTYPDGREFVGVGIVPDVEAHSAQEDIASGYDRVLNRGLQVLNSQLK